MVSERPVVSGGFRPFGEDLYQVFGENLYEEIHAFTTDRAECRLF